MAAGCSLPSCSVAPFGTSSMMPPRNISTASSVAGFGQELAGFASATRKVELIAGSTLAQDFTLGIAALAETLTVSGSIPLVEAA